MVLYDRSHDLLRDSSLFWPQDVRYLEFFESRAGDIIENDEVIASHQLHDRAERPRARDIKGGLRMM